MRALSYLAMLATCLLATLPLEGIFRLGVLRRPRVLCGALIAAGAPFLCWDVWATDRGHWSFDTGQTLGLVLPGGLPVEEVAFFVVIPLAVVLTYEAVGVVLARRAGGVAQ
ncbi:MAG: lycopene cyclase domain-containing protein [Sporichthyaceae bacterium]